MGTGRTSDEVAHTHVYICSCTHAYTHLVEIGEFSLGCNFFVELILKLCT